MREIKFRIFDKEKNDFVTGNQGSTYSLSTGGKVWDLSRDSKKLFPVEGLEVSECIGLHDDFGNLIFEGDILLSSNEYGIFLQLIGFGDNDMEYGSMLTGFKIVNGKTLESDNYEINDFKPFTQDLIKKYKIPTMVEDNMIQDGWWIIGNKYQNPELMNLLEEK
ncbi:hypothetical protein EII29_09765 [Leptotrichia sp. OH3620_COT-345]|uniref:YopX family protein n=1 Tax=Leptotrichia sp. OH3620_COT-345 TaxID=2491048 RepID=UPI000F645555|nr:YopX family protein [Leptotrichia sp. OH3620_COT-345]RRD38802.1 hypothetical protein EII29_09765 [Leptotrichia sp. OH3620_COT-345]